MDNKNGINQIIMPRNKLVKLFFVVCTNRFKNSFYTDEFEVIIDDVCLRHDLMNRNPLGI